MSDTHQASVLAFLKNAIGNLCFYSLKYWIYFPQILTIQFLCSLGVPQYISIDNNYHDIKIMIYKKRKHKITKTIDKLYWLFMKDIIILIFYYYYYLYC